MHRFAVVCAVVVLGVIVFGGHTTTHNAGMAFADWPTSAGYQMFVLPMEIMFDDLFKFLEHSHRLIAALAGLCTVVLAGWLIVGERRLWVKGLGVAAAALVLIQGILGGVRVLWNMEILGAFHGVLGQSYFVVMVTLAWVTSRFWLNFRPDANRPLPGWFGVAVGLICAGLLVQLSLGAGMRQFHNPDPAVPDFPMAYGVWWPKVSGEGLSQINQLRTDTLGLSRVQAAEVHLHLAHRYGGILLGLAVLAVSLVGPSLVKGYHWLACMTSGWMVLVGGQVMLGVLVVLSGKHPEITTFHVILGAVVLAWGFMLLWTIVLDRWSRRQQRPDSKDLPDLAHV